MSWCWLAALADPPPDDDLVDAADLETALAELTLKHLVK